MVGIGFGKEIIKRIFEFINDQLLFNGLSYLVKYFQLTIMPNKLKDMANQDTRVIVHDSILKFHDNDRRGQILLDFNTKITNL